MNIKTKLKKNDLIDIYTDYQDEQPSTYEGKAILIKKIRNGDSFYRTDEEIKIREKKQYTKKERLSLEKYHKLKLLFQGNIGPPEKEITKFRKELISLRKDNLDDIENMMRVINTYKQKYNTSVRRIKALLTDFEPDYIIRYIQQDREKWQPSIYSYERWLVEFVEDKTGWKTSFRTERNIRILVKLNPNELSKAADIRKYTTYNNGVSSLNLFKREDEDEDDYDGDEDDICAEINDMFDEYELNIED